MSVAGSCTPRLEAPENGPRPRETSQRQPMWRRYRLEADRVKLDLEGQAAEVSSGCATRAAYIIRSIVFCIVGLQKWRQYPTVRL